MSRDERLVADTTLEHLREVYYEKQQAQHRSYIVFQRVSGRFEGYIHDKKLDICHAVNDCMDNADNVKNGNKVI